MLGDSRRISRARLIGSLLSRIQEEAPKLIALKREGAYWDFKKEWHKDNSELIHDILCLANNLDAANPPRSVTIPPPRLIRSEWRVAP